MRPGSGRSETKRLQARCRQAWWIIALSAGAVMVLMSWGVVAGWMSPPGHQASARSELSLPELRAKAIVVLDVDSGELLVSVAGHTLQPPGPLAQLATLLAAWYERSVGEFAAAEEQVLVSGRAAERAGVRMGLRYGELVDLAHVVQGLWYLGASDAAITLTEHVWGSEAAFARQITYQLLPFGARETQLVSPEGLNRPDQYTTAYDMARIAQAVLQDPVLGSLAGRRRVTLSLPDGRQPLIHVNSFLLRYPGATGVKSGFDEQAGYVAAASARRNGRHLVAVILGAETADARYKDVAAFLDYSFRNLQVLREFPAVDALPYDVEPGDTLSAIARRFAIDPNVLQEFNGISDPGSLQTGARLWIPQVGEAEP